MKRLKSTPSLINISTLVAAALLAMVPLGVRAGAFTHGNLAVEQLDVNSTSSTFSIIEVSSVSGSVAQVIPIPSANATNALRQANNGSTGRVSLSDDGSLIAFPGANDSNGVPNELTVLLRGVGTLNASGTYSMPTRITGISGNQARAATTLDNANWIIADKGGVYLNGASTPKTNANLRVVRSFGGTIYGLNAQSVTGNGLVETVPVAGTPLGQLNGLVGIVDGSAQDFYMIASGNNGVGVYDTIYINSLTILNKYALTNGTWGFMGSQSWGLPSGQTADGLCAAKDGQGGVILYATTGVNNYIFTATDAAAWNAAPNLQNFNFTFCVSPGTGVYLKGIDFAPSGSGGANATPPALTPAANVTVNSNSFLITLPAGNWSAWFGSITNISVGGTNLYSTSPSQNFGISFGANSITNDMTANPIYHTAGALTIVIKANGYSDDFVTQTIAPGTAAKVLIAQQPSAPTANGGTLVKNPMLSIADQYGNPVSDSISIAHAVGNGAWSFGSGSGTSQPFVNGTATFTNLSATSPAAVSGATITFTVTGSSLSQNTTNSSTFNIPAPRTTGFSPGNLAVFQLDTAINNSTFSILELSSTVANQSSPVNTFAISATGPNALRNSTSGTTGRMTDNDDGTLVCFTGFKDGTSATPQENAIVPRGVGTLDPFGNFVLQASYTGVGGGTANQTRSGTSLDDITWFVGDKGGVYTNDQTSPYIGGTPDLNVRAVKSFGGVLYAIQQQSGSVIATLLQIVPVNGYVMPGIPTTGSGYYPVAGLPQDATVVDFSLVKSGNNGSTNDVVYYLDNSGVTAGAINKYYYSGVDEHGIPAYTSAGSVATANGGDGFCAALNTNGGFDIYYTTGAGGTTSNSVVKVHDSAAWNQTIVLDSTNVLYTAPAQATLKGIAFAPVAHTLTGASIGGQFVLSFTAATGLNFGVFATNDIAAPRTNWPAMGQAVESPVGSGNYQYTNPTPTNLLFYTISRP